MSKKIMWLFFLGGINVHPLYASQYPMVTDISVEVVNDKQAKYNFSQMLVEIGPSADTLPNRKYICFGHRHADLDGNDYAGCAGVSAPIRKNETIGQAARRLHAGVAGSKTSEFHQGRLNVTECIGYFAADSNQPKPYWSSWASAVYPAGSCVYVPPANNWCKLISPTLVLDHGTISLKEAEGHSAEDSLNVQCSSGTTMRLKLIGDLDYIPLTPEGKSYLTIDGKAPGSLFALPGGSSTLAVKDKLSNLTLGGVYYGSSILVIEPF
ncbi:hypothetical protein [Serratia fonticola]|uniref:hypothetical protein n=1 Tax=Serratia fonticola TaxID=47917 RepID=UPI00217CBF50|nr:hypothetical protein [Serratia fonticola]CAI2027002.1 Uncharacterised protein [Serratia fonticola]CAI2029892.1 Uncharacterised protein [Serratia fonticola]CAI2032772.1 Uncharacterised protein [Serratia fonticola]